MREQLLTLKVALAFYIRINIYISGAEIRDGEYTSKVPDPIEANQIIMEELSWTRKDPEPYLGDKTVVSKILNRKRESTLEMIRRLHIDLLILAELLIGATS